MTPVGIHLTWLGHATVVVDLDGVRVVSDPLVRRHNGILRRRGGRPSQEAWVDADAVLLSHLHHDHAEVASLRLFAGVPVLCAPANATWVRRKGLDGRGLDEAEWFPLGPGGDVEVRLVPAVHAARPMPHRPNAANGHLVRGPSGVVWLAGDTDLYDDMAAIPDLAGGRVDVAVVPVGGWGPRLSPGHMGPREAAVACRVTGARHAVPVHWKTLHVPGGHRVPRGWMDAAGPRFEEDVAAVAPECRPVVLEVGESATFPPGPTGEG
jgi:L-ascorbate metabolism protein UlaG (beta-lactamase superfamily)